MRTNGRARIGSLALSTLAAASACGGGSSAAAESAVAKDAAASAAKPGQRTGVDRSACDLLTVAEVSAAVGTAVTAKETNRETGRSDCQWDGADGIVRFQLVGYWTGGKEGWKILAESRGMAKDIIKQQERANLDSIVEVGPVVGVGDKAVFSPLLPSLVLKDDVLLEFTTSLLPKPALQFRPLAMRALSRL
jgi:hypothetical protein